ncbi:DUF4271 domain-containing protein [Mesonia aestuariivivens]|uniref:DUF4271 domain-containing protein n=1 Tax=Mesonia aestuariivivens TaxID=2796128 RepID=UPI0034E1E10B
MLFTILLLLTFSKIYFTEDFRDFFRIFISNKYFTSHKRTISVFNLFSFILFIGHSLVISLAIFYFLKLTPNTTITKNSYLLYIQILVGYNILIGVKYLIEKIIGEVFTIHRILDNYIFYKITYKNLLSFLMLPFLIMLIYKWQNSMIFAYIIFAIWGIANILILLKYYSKQQKLVLGNWFYFILYLCTLEIAPYFILYKVFTSAQ